MENHDDDDEVNKLFNLLLNCCTCKSPLQLENTEDTEEEDALTLLKAQIGIDLNEIGLIILIRFLSKKLL